MRRVRCHPTFLGSLLFGGLILGPTPGHSQVGEGISVLANPPAVRLGQLFNLEIHLRSPEGWVLEVPDTILGLRGFHSAGPAQLSQTDVGSAGADWTIAYPLVPFRSGYRPLPSLSLRMREPDAIEGRGSTRMVQVPLGGVPVESVLPPPGAVIEPAPPLLPPRSGPGPRTATFLSLTGLLLSGMGLLATRKKPNTGNEGLAPASGSGNPGGSQSLLAQLREILQTVPSSASDASRVFDETAPLLRELLEAQTSTSLVGCTTPELMGALSEVHPRMNLGGLERVLRKGDQARFRKTLPSSEDARVFQEDLLTWLDAAGERNLAARAGGSDV